MYTIISFFFFFNDTATTEIYTLSLHDALPISSWFSKKRPAFTSSLPKSEPIGPVVPRPGRRFRPFSRRSEEHTSELQSHSDLVCRLLLEKKKTKTSLKTADEVSKQIERRCVNS